MPNISDYLSTYGPETRRRNFYNAILNFDNLIENLTLFSTYSAIFFSPALNIAKKMRDLCIRAFAIQIHRRLCADRILNETKGFRLEALLKIYRYWRVLEEVPLPMQEWDVPDGHIYHWRFIWKLETPEFDLFSDVFQDMGASDPTDYREDFPVTTHRQFTQIGDSDEFDFCTYESNADTNEDSEYEDGYLEIEEADFAEFEEQWRLLVENGNSDLNDEDLSPEAREMLAEYRRIRAEREEKECNDADSEDTDDSGNSDESETVEDLGSDDDSSEDSELPSILSHLTLNPR
uniref:Uncharacterized protein n=1 Tax=Caenorhabditis tropicalis TaxID=1561998 RepID=A0A1I7URZ3_9PELO